LGSVAAAEEALRIASSVLPRDAMVGLLKRMLADSAQYAEAAARIAPEYVDALEQGGVGGDVRGELLESAPLLPADVAARLLGVPRPVLIAALNAKQRRTILELAAGDTGHDLLAEPAARNALVALMLRAIETCDPGDREFELVKIIADKWPAEGAVQLMELTALEPLQTLKRKSGYFAVSLARRLLSRNSYTVGVLGGEPLVLSHLCRALRVLTP
jgi:hypothetical protein